VPFSVLHVREKGKPHFEVYYVFAGLACGARHDERGVVSIGGDENEVFGVKAARGIQEPTTRVRI
jgi:uncharacterized protein YpmB